MKKIIAIIISILSAVTLLSCATASGHNQEGNTDATPSKYGLHMHVSPGSVTPSGLRLTMVNNSEDITFGYGAMFSIERYANGIWEEVSTVEDFAWITILLSVTPGKTIDENINWEFMHGELEEGKYRIVRNFMVGLWNYETREEERKEIYLYSVFTIGSEWEDNYSVWQIQQEELSAAAFARFEGLDLEILEYSSVGLTFSLTNNNPNYSYVINSVFVGWSDSIEGQGSASALEYSVFRDWSTREFPNWPFDHQKIMNYGDNITLEVNWYYEIGHLVSTSQRLSPNPYIFDLTVAVTLDVDQEYINNNFNHTIPGLPNETHSITADFDLAGDREGQGE